MSNKKSNYNLETELAVIKNDVKHILKAIDETIKDTPTKSEILLHRWIMGGMCVAIFTLYMKII